MCPWVPPSSPIWYNSGDDVTLRANGLFVDNAGFNDAGFQPWRFAMGATDANKRQG